MLSALTGVAHDWYLVIGRTVMNAPASVSTFR